LLGETLNSFGNAFDLMAVMLLASHTFQAQQAIGASKAQKGKLIHRMHTTKFLSVLRLFRTFAFRKKELIRRGNFISGMYFRFNNFLIHSKVDLLMVIIIFLRISIIIIVNILLIFIHHG
jgi:hypothetical protein